MSGELRAVSRAALRPKALSRKTKAVALAKAVGAVAAVGTLAVGVGALAHMLYSTPPEESEGERMGAMPRNAQEFVQKQKEFSDEAARHIAKLAVARKARLNAIEGDRKGRNLTPQQQRELQTLVLQAGKLYDQAGDAERAEQVLEKGGCHAAAGEIADRDGSCLPLAPDAATRLAAADPRPSIAERYAGRADYVARVQAVVDERVRERLLLAQDAQALVERARQEARVAP